jgi:TonB-dependent SusC/RagA subfamily outer membrane receptor
LDFSIPKVDLLIFPLQILLNKVSSISHIDNSNFGTNQNNSGSDNSIGDRSGGGIYSDGGDGLSSINPDDIESMTVLKGATPAALYGSSAKDGVIMITTLKHTVMVRE